LKFAAGSHYHAPADKIITFWTKLLQGQKSRIEIRIDASLCFAAMSNKIKARYSRPTCKNCSYHRAPF